MAGPARGLDPALCPRHSCPPLLAGSIHLHYLAHLPLQSIFDQPDVHDELYDIVSGGMADIWCLLTSNRMLIVLAFGSLISWIVRYRFMNMYTRLPPEPQRKEPHIDLFPDTQDGDSKPGLANYLDEFLSAIKVFGYRRYYSQL